MQRLFYSIEEGFVPMEMDDMPPDLVFPLPVEQGGTGLDHQGATNQVLVTGGPSGLFWRFITPINIHTTAKTGAGTKIVVSTLTSLTTGDMLQWNGTDWVNVAAPSTPPHNLLDGSQNQDTVAQTATRGSIIVGNATPKWDELVLGSAGKILRSDGTDLKYSTATYPDTATGTGTILRADGTNWVATTATYPTTVTVSRLLYASASNVISDLATANSSILVTDGSGVPSLATDIPTAVTIGGSAIVRAGANSNITDLTGLTGAITKPSSVTLATGGALRTDTGAGNTLLLQARDVDGASYTTFATLTANNTPTMDLASAVTHNSKTIPSGTFTSLGTADYVGWDGSGWKNMTVGPGSGITVDYSTSGVTIGQTATTGYWMIPSPYPETATTIASGGANNVYAWRFYLPCRLTVNSLHFRITANAGSDHYQMGIYDNPGTTRLFVSTVFTSGSGTKSTTLGAAVALDPGFYWCAWTADNTNATWQSVTAATNFYNILNAGTTQYCTASNASAAGVLPTTLGTLTTVSGQTSMPFMKIQN